MKDHEELQRETVVAFLQNEFLMNQLVERYAGDFGSWDEYLWDGHGGDIESAMKDIAYRAGFVV